MPAAVEPEGDFGLIEQTSIEPVHRLSLIVAAMLLDPPGIIAQWFVTMIAAAISTPPTMIAIFRPISRIYSQFATIPPRNAATIKLTHSEAKGFAT